jgi:peptidoglycan hydrolase-like protein with peptidoglycan-binding domain
VRIQPKVLSSIVVIALAIPVAPAARADGSAFVGGLVGGMLGTAIGNAAQQQRRETVVIRQQPQRTVVRQAPVVNTYEREQNREVQTALNYFGFPAGAPDGVLGRNSRAAISQYQGFMGYPPSGYLSEYERTFLVAAYNRALIGGPQVQTQMATYGQGPRGLLLAYRAEQQGVSPAAPVPPAAAQAVTAAAPVAPAAPAPAPAPAPVEILAAEPEPEPEPEAPAAPAGLPSFVAAAPDASMASACNRVSLVTSTNGGFVTLANLTDPDFALEEQFCLARTYAIEEGDRLATTVQGVSAADIRAQCEAFSPAMRPYIAMLGDAPRAAVVEEVRGFILETGAAPAQIAGNARVCLGVGYRTDNAELALGSALMLDAAGEAAYGEHVGHHLMQGLGAPRRADRAVDWLGGAIGAMEAGASPVVAPGAPERVALLRRSLDMATGRPAGGETLSEAAAPAGSLPGFVLPTAPAGSN